MAHQFTDTFCTITTSAQSPYETVGGSITYSSAYARFTPPAGCKGGGVLISSNGGLRKNLPNTITTTIAFLSYGHSGSLNNNQRIIGFWNSGSEVLSLMTSASGAVQFYNGSSLIGAASATGLILANQTGPISGIEVQIVMSASVGVANCWLNGTQILTQTNLNTGTSSINQVQIGDLTGGQAAMYTDYLRVWDATGSTQNAPVGIDRQPVTKLPAGAGSNTNFSPTGFVNNYQCVSQIPPNGSDYVSSSVAGTADDYVLPSGSLRNTPSQVVATSYYQKTDSNTRTYANGVLSNGVVGVGPTFTANSGLTWVQSCIATDPNTGLAWTAAGADVAHFYHQEVS
jgi:hypothetical protein